MSCSKSAIVAPILICLTCCSILGCVDRARVNDECKWGPEALGPLDLKAPDQEQHLYDDVELAEESAVRYADLAHKERTGYSGHGGLLDNGELSDRCRESLLKAIAAIHQVPIERVREAHLHGRRPLAWDASVMILFGALYMLIARAVAGLIARRFGVDAPAEVGALVVASIAVSAGGVLLGGLWSTVFELIRVGNDHLGGHRPSRIPWDAHSGVLYVAGVCVFWLVVALNKRIWNRFRREASHRAV
jgi:hypothetical protein